jgi:GAF domain-containing protein
MNLGISIRGYRSKSKAMRDKILSLERKRALAIRFTKLIDEQDWDNLRLSKDVEHSILLDAFLKLGEKISFFSEKEKEQRWIAEGLAKLSTVIRNYSTDLNGLSENVLNELVKQVGANQGAIFVLKERENERPILEMKAMYARDRKKNLLKEIDPGEGLVGQCYLDGDKIYVDQVPIDYTHITSGLGEAVPKSLLLIPLKLNDRTTGVIELASFTPFTSAQFVFIDRMTEGIAGAIQSVKDSERTKKLLTESELITAQLQNSEKDLNRSLTEMRLIQEDQARKQAEIQKAYALIQNKSWK